MNDDMLSIESDQALCIHCVKPYNGLDHFCPHCGGPVSQHSAVDPMGQIFSAGHAYTNATSGRPSKIVLIGIWLIFAPQLVPILIGLFWIIGWMISAIAEGSDGQVGYLPDNLVSEFFKLFAIVGLGIVYWLILWKVTARYIRFHADKTSSLDEEDEERRTDTDSIDVNRLV